MKKDFSSIIKQFVKINKMRYIKGINNNIYNSCGLTFEKMLNKKPDTSYLPDYGEIEIKTTQRFSGFGIGLFSIKFDGPNFNEGQYLLEKYGYCKKLNNKKELIVTLKINKKVLVNSGYYFELSVSYTERNIGVNIYDNNLRFIERTGIVNFDSISQRASLKLKKMALIYASKKKINDNLYFRYYKLDCLIFKGFDNFIKMIECGVVNVIIMQRYSKSKNTYGKSKNKCVVFHIYRDKILSIYDRIYSIED